MATGFQGYLYRASSLKPLVGIVVEIVNSTTLEVVTTATTNSAGKFSATGLTDAALFARPRIIGQDYVVSPDVTELYQPTIANFSNANHDHADADDGGLIAHASLASVTANQHHNQAHSINGSDHTSGPLSIANGGTNATSFAAGRIPYFDGTRFVDSGSFTYADTHSSIELNADNTAGKAPFIDFHFSNAGSDYTARFQATADDRLDLMYRTGGTIITARNGGLSGSGLTNLTAGYVLRASSTTAFGFGTIDNSSLNIGWSNHTPTWTAASGTPSFGNATIHSRYIQIGKLVVWHFYCVFGTTSAFGNAGGDWSFTLPVTATSSGGEKGLGAAWGFDSSLNTRYVLTARVQATTTLQLIGDDDADQVCASIPFTWDDSDRIAWTVMYEAA